MEAEELDVQLEELEVRLERLRALYEQYFLGIEKLEPTVARKDVDRRIYILRREKIRNTGKRFKLQTIIQRYNTFQQYWHRICREIENGTYKRHLLRAERNFGPQDLLTIAARKRFGKEQQGARAAESAAPEAAPPPSAPSPPIGRPSPRPPARPQPLDSLDLDMDFLGDWDPASAPKRAPAPSASAARRPSVMPGPPGRRSDPPRASAAPPPRPPAAAAPAPTRIINRAPPKPAPKPAAAAAALDEAKIRDLHGRLNDLKRQNREAGQVSLEGLTKSLRATQEKLQKQHAGRRIEFDVVVKDGKAVVKPIVR